MTDRFAQWLDITMDNQGIRGRTLARRVGVHDSAISRWRNGQAVPSLDAVMRLAKALGCDPLQLAVTAELLDGDEIGVQPLELPPQEARRAHVRNQIKAIKGLSTSSIQRLLETYEADMKEETKGA